MSPDKTIHIRDEDMPVWERAEKAAEHARQSLSQFVTRALRREIDDVEDVGWPGRGTPPNSESGPERPSHG